MSIELLKTFYYAFNVCRNCSDVSCLIPDTGNFTLLYLLIFLLDYLSKGCISLLCLILAHYTYLCGILTLFLLVALGFIVHIFNLLHPTFKKQ